MLRTWDLKILDSPKLFCDSPQSIRSETRGDPLAKKCREKTRSIGLRIFMSMAVAQLCTCSSLRHLKTHHTHALWWQAMPQSWTTLSDVADRTGWPQWMHVPSCVLKVMSQYPRDPFGPWGEHQYIYIHLSNIIARLMFLPHTMLPGCHYSCADVPPLFAKRICFDRVFISGLVTG